MFSSFWCDVLLSHNDTVTIYMYLKEYPADEYIYICKDKLEKFSQLFK